MTNEEIRKEWIKDCGDKYVLGSNVYHRMIENAANWWFAKLDLQREEFEMILAEVIDDLYLQYKPNFCDWENRTHKLGWFKEGIKAKMHERLMKELSTGATGERSE